ncbi:hotdog fold thioesterase [Aeromonas schubertii]|uniref:Hotdog fold thioesterase n=1 Tax=Aeromonas schubertii TaxID=652 RepID=A0ABS7V7D4_9GAMM|nr:hotdog fold thioesterase [Aeromonas schubertii]MBZ6064938.1 hotdog fold thioesterase [Aeromonas schubertii]MBZ6071829.1 hotdog fold thioesterase [Aeromonas schubertii]QCG48486.1 hotdog fold thioesterase [Aeromonas schubertii]
MSIWKKPMSLEGLEASSHNTLMAHLDIHYSGFGDDWIAATMPVDSRTHQPLGMLHGGASVVLAETLGSIAANMAVDGDHYCVGLDINANHIRAKREGVVTGVTRPVHLGATTQVWQIEIKDERDRLICTSRITMAVLKAKRSGSTL